jgi:hypothetical protein
VPDDGNSCAEKCSRKIIIIRRRRRRKVVIDWKNLLMRDFFIALHDPISVHITYLQQMNSNASFFVIYAVILAVASFYSRPFSSVKTRSDFFKRNVTWQPVRCLVHCYAFLLLTIVQVVPFKYAISGHS